jgi:hypothetical protein
MKNREIEKGSECMLGKGDYLRMPVTRDLEHDAFFGM